MQNKKIRVLIIGYLPPPQEGTAKITEAIVESEYLKNKFEIIFMPLLKRNTPSKRGRLALKNVLFTFMNVINYISFILRYNIDIVYMPLAQNRFGFLRDSIFIMIGKMLNKKICVHFHGGNFDLFIERQNEHYKKYAKFIIKKIDRLILLAEKFKKQFEPFMSIEKMSVLYNCVPKILCFKQEGSKDNNMVRILFIGYLSKAKGAYDLIQSIPIIIKECNKPIEFVLCGPPVDKETNITFLDDMDCGYSKINKFIKEKNIQQYVRLYTTLTEEEKDRLFNQSDIFVFPTYSEGCGLVALEAMSYGMPLITTGVGALEEMLEAEINCLIVKPGDYNNLAKMVLKLIKSPELIKTMGRNNRELVKNKYNREEYTKQLGVIWSSIALICTVFLW